MNGLMISAPASRQRSSVLIKEYLYRPLNILYKAFSRRYIYGIQN